MFLFELFNNKVSSLVLSNEEEDDADEIGGVMGTIGFDIDELDE
jgi:hypothetical protein